MLRFSSFYEYLIPITPFYFYWNSTCKRLCNTKAKRKEKKNIDQDKLRNERGKKKILKTIFGIQCKLFQLEKKKYPREPLRQECMDELPLHIQSLIEGWISLCESQTQSH